jgi:hypothetical protein
MWQIQLSPILLHYWYEMGVAINQNIYFWLLDDECHFCPEMEDQIGMGVIH